MSQVRQAIDILMKALPSLQVGSDPHKSVLSAINSISKVVPATSEIPGVQQSGLRDMQQQAQQSGMMQALMRAMGQSAGSPAGGGLPAPAVASTGAGAAI